MKKKVVKKSVKQNTGVKKSRTWVWIVLAFLFGAIFGFGLNYTISNWSSFFTEPELCESVEKVLSKKLHDYDKKSKLVSEHIEIAKIYATLSERGCEKNAGKYEALAKKEMDVIRALNDDVLKNEIEALEIVELYTRLLMPTEAEKLVRKTMKMSEPAKKFIKKLENIIEESKNLLCEDGQKPDSNGCCAGEVYTDAGGGWMVCCPNGGDNCFPPIK